VNEFITEEIEGLIFELLNQELDLAAQLEYLKLEITSSIDYSLDKLFALVDDCNMQWIDTQSLRRFLVKCQYVPDDEVLIGAIRRLDLDGDSRINFKEFCDGIQTIETFSRDSLSNFKLAFTQQLDNLVSKK
jgi:Ca2+-binding EF-hand superfamily protein